MKRGRRAPAGWVSLRFVQVGLLGPLRVVGDDGVEVRVAAPKERAVLAVLGLRAPAVVSAGELIDALWGEDPPRSAAKTLQNYVSSLRRLLPAGAIETVGGGYRLGGGRRGGRRWLRGAGRPGRRALAAGDPGGGGGGSGGGVGAVAGGAAGGAGRPAGWGMAEAARLGELRRDCEEQLAEARLALGEHRSLVGDLEAAVAAEPLRERRWAQLMLALYRSGRQADALRAFQRLRTILADELGHRAQRRAASPRRCHPAQKPELDWHAPSEPASSQVRSGPAGAPERRATRSSLRPGPSPTGGLVTFVFTDIEGSTRLWEQYPDRMAAVLERHDRLVGEPSRPRAGGCLRPWATPSTPCSPAPARRVRAALAVQAAMAAGDWGDIGGLAVRIGVYTGEAQLVEGEWRGRALNRCARLRDAAAGGQILASHATIDLVGDDLADQAVITNLGEQQLRGVTRAEQVHQVEPCRPIEPAG